MKPTESRTWDSSDIEDVKERLPEGLLSCLSISSSKPPLVIPSGTL